MLGLSGLKLTWALTSPTWSQPSAAHVWTVMVFSGRIGEQCLTVDRSACGDTRLIQDDSALDRRQGHRSWPRPGHQRRVAAAGHQHASHQHASHQRRRPNSTSARKLHIPSDATQVFPQFPTADDSPE